MKKSFDELRKKLIRTSSINETKKLVAEYKEKTEDMLDNNKKVKRRILLAGDGAVLLTRAIPNLDISLFFAKPPTHPSLQDS